MEECIKYVLISSFLSPARYSSLRRTPDRGPGNLEDTM